MVQASKPRPTAQKLPQEQAASKV